MQIALRKLKNIQRWLLLQSIVSQNMYVKYTNITFLDTFKQDHNTYS